MATTYGDFPGVQVTVAGGGITAVAIGSQEHLVIFGAANYQDDGDFSGSDGDEDPISTSASGDLESVEQINARREADARFGDGSKLANGLREALANGANVEYIYGVAPKRYQTLSETFSSATGTLSSAPIFEDAVDDESDIVNVTFTDTTDGALEVNYYYDGAPPQPSSATDEVNLNPLTGEWAADSTPTGDYNVDYKWLDWNSAFQLTDVRNIVNENETGVYTALTDADNVSVDLESEISNQRDEFKLINGLSGAEPNDNQVVTSDGNPLSNDFSNYKRRDARYDTVNYDTANQSIDADYYFKPAPVRPQNEKTTILGGVGGLFAGNDISNPIYNDQLHGYDALEQSLSKSQADNLRNENVIPIRQAGSIRVKDNISTSTESDWERTFWNRRIADRVILVGKVIGDSIVGQINDSETRNAAERLIKQEMRGLVADRVLRENTSDTQNWYVDVYPDSDLDNQVNIDIGFTPYDVVERIEETITINT